MRTCISEVASLGLAEKEVVLSKKQIYDKLQKHPGLQGDAEVVQAKLIQMGKLKAGALNKNLEHLQTPYCHARNI